MRVGDRVSRFRGMSVARVALLAGFSVALLVTGLLQPVAANAATGGKITGRIDGFYTEVTLYNADTSAALKTKSVSQTDSGTGDNYWFTNLAPGNYKVGFVTYPDTMLGGIPRNPDFWQDKATLAEATVLTVTGSETFTGINPVFEYATPSVSGSLAATSGDPCWGCTGIDKEFRVFASDGTLVEPSQTRLEGDGTFRIWGLPAGQYYVSAQYDRLAPTFVGDVGLLSQATLVTVTDGATTAVGTITMPLAATISGTVRGPDGASLGEGARVEMRVLNTATGLFEPLADPRVYVDSYYIAALLWPGTYKVRFAGPSGSGLAPEWWNDQPYEQLATAVTLAPGGYKDLDAQLAPIQGYRLGGADRYVANVNMSKETFPASEGPYNIEVLYIASGEKYPDALSAGPAAIHSGGGLLLVQPNAIPASTRAEIVRLNPQKIIVVGGPASVTPAVVAELKTLSNRVTRIGGADRYEVSRKVILDAFACDTGTCLDTIFIATGNNFPDALSAGPAAGHIDAAVLLVDGTAPKLSDSTKGLLADLGVRNAYIAGGKASVTAGIESSLSAVLDGTVYRFAGSDRFEAAALINDRIFDHSSTVFIATGMGFADALAGGPLAGAYDAPLYLSPKECLPMAAVTSLLALDPAEIVLLGGPNSISDDVLYYSC